MFLKWCFFSDELTSCESDSNIKIKYTLMGENLYDCKKGNETPAESKFFYMKIYKKFTVITF